MNVAASIVTAIVLAGTATYDGLSTVHFLRKGLDEQNPIFGKRPSVTHLFVLGGVIIAAELLAMFKSPAFYRDLIAAVLLVQSAFHIYYGRRNFTL